MNIDYSTLTNKKLKQICKQNQIKGYSSLKKQELIDVIIQHHVEKLLHIELTDDMDEDEITQILRYANMYDPTKNVITILMNMQSDWRNVEFCDTDSDDEVIEIEEPVKDPNHDLFERYFYANEHLN